MQAKQLQEEFVDEMMILNGSFWSIVQGYGLGLFSQSRKLAVDLWT
jgi:hypothetical protein